MKRQIKWTAALSTAAIMTALTPTIASPVMAQTAGWTQQDGIWMFYDKDGYYLTDSWKKHDGEWFYLDENGHMAVDKQVDDYYIGTDGKRVYNQWVKIANEDHWGFDDEPEYYWYFYGTDGKAVTSRMKAIDGKTYYFNSNGQMATGLLELDGSTYYFGTDGEMRKGWVQLQDSESDHEDSTFWHYFDSTGKMVMNQVDRKIGEGYFTFADGKMQTGWYQTPAQAEAAALSEASAQSDTSAQASASAAQAKPASAGDYQFYDEDGKRASGWRTIEGISGISQEGENYRFYFKNGRPYTSADGIQVFAIGTTRYGFNAKGEMQTGLQSVTLEDGSTANFYFGNDGIMKVGKQTIFNEDNGINETWFFHNDGAKKGQGYHGIRDNVIYEHGLRRQADSELRYAPVQFDGKTYLVNTSGAIQKASASSKSSLRPELGAGFRDLKSSYDTVWTVDVNGIIQ